MTETLPPEVPMEDALINDAVLFINERVAAHVYKGALEIGQYVLERFFNGDIALAGSKNPFKPVSYRKLCDHPDLSLSSSALLNMVKTAAQSRFLAENGIPEEALNYTQKVYLARLENNDRKIGLARECMENGLTTRELKARIQELCAQTVPLTVAGSVEKYLNDVDRWLGRVRAPEGMTNHVYMTSHLEPADKEKILSAANGIIEEMTAALTAVRQMVMILTGPPLPPIYEGPGPMET